jgi:hypothetical protein
MGALTSWLRDEFTKFGLFPRYIKAIVGEWMNFLFGESIIAVVFLIWWALGSPPLVAIFVVAMLVAGYFAWRPSFLRLVPRMDVTETRIQETDTNISGLHRIYVQVLPICLTDAPISGAQGRLLRVWRWSNAQSDWEATKINEPLDLLWSNFDSAPRTLELGVDQRLNILWRDNHGRMGVDVSGLPYRATDVLNTNDIFKFDIRVSSAECRPVDKSLRIKLSEKWNTVSVEIMGDSASRAVDASSRDSLG